MKRPLHVILLILAFLFAQGGLAAHAVSHVASPAYSGTDGGPAPEPACDLCAGYGSLSSGAPFPYTGLLPLCFFRHEIPLAAAEFPVGRLSFQSRARAPPVFS